MGLTIAWLHRCRFHFLGASEQSRMTYYLTISKMMPPNDKPSVSGPRKLFLGRTDTCVVRLCNRKSSSCYPDVTAPSFIPNCSLYTYSHARCVHIRVLGRCADLLVVPGQTLSHRPSTQTGPNTHTLRDCSSLHRMPLPVLISTAQSGPQWPNDIHQIVRLQCTTPHDLNECLQNACLSRAQHSTLFL
jgi:hypothetical protein